MQNGWVASESCANVNAVKLFLLSKLRNGLASVRGPLLKGERRGYAYIQFKPADFRAGVTTPAWTDTDGAGYPIVTFTPNFGDLRNRTAVSEYLDHGKGSERAGQSRRSDHEGTLCTREIDV